ncbi:MAG: site-specific DNA-methyltransferase [Bacteroidales bacterium]|nr:site-specific DNA-methyltransferase [Bacteroidales bacterium]
MNLSEIKQSISQQPYYEDENGLLYNADCLDIMKQLPDKCVDLVLTDPPYGIGISRNPVRQRFNKSDWDKSAPTKEYFDNMLRIGINQIIWGGNYFSEYLRSSKHFLVWNKLQPEDFTLGMCEMAWSSLDKPAKMFTQSVQVEGNPFHPTQKPVALMQWCLENYSKQGDTVLDPYLGSGTTAVACYRTRRNYIGIEISKDYCDIAVKRIKAEKDKMALFNGVNK